MPGISSAMASRATTVRPSNIRSTATEESEGVDARR